MRKQMAETNAEIQRITQELQDSKAMIKELVAASAKTSTNATKSITSLTEPTSLQKPANKPRIHEACNRTIARQKQIIQEQAERIKRLEACTGTLAKESMTCLQKYEDARFNYGEE